MREYETVFVLHPSLDEKEVESEIQGVCDLITGGGGTVEDVERWGRRRLAYEIQKVHEATYTLVRYHAPAQIPKDLDRRFRLNEKLLRHLTVLSEGPPPPPPRPESEEEERPRVQREEGDFEIPRAGGPHSRREPPSRAPAPAQAPAETAGNEEKEGQEQA